MGKMDSRGNARMVRLVVIILAILFSMIVPVVLMMGWLGTSMGRGGFSAGWSDQMVSIGQPVRREPAPFQGGDETTESDAGAESGTQRGGPAAQVPVTDSVRHRTAPGPCEIGVYGGLVRKDYGKWAVCTNWLNDQSVIYSFGIGEDASFDVDCVIRHNSTLFCFDPTISSESFTRSVNAAKPSTDWGREQLLHFEQIGLGAEDGTVKFFTKGGKGSAVSTEGMQGYGKLAVEAQVLTVPSVMEKFGHSYVDVLKVDVEGAEFDVFDDPSLAWIDTMQPQQVLLEFHARLFQDGFEKQQKVVQNLQRRGYQVAWKSGNKWEYLFAKESL